MKVLHRLTASVIAAAGLAACSPLEILDTLSSDSPREMIKADEYR